MQHVTKQTIPSWTGFNFILRYTQSVLQDNIGYLPTINALATSLATFDKTGT